MLLSSHGGDNMAVGKDKTGVLVNMDKELKKKLWGGHLWNPSYFVATVSENTEEQIRRYIQSQKRK